MAATKEPAFCACANYQVEGAGTGCTSTTKKKFAPGHDAKLRSLLVKAGVAGHSVHVKEEDGSVSTMGHLEAAKLHGLVDHVEHGVKLALERLAKKQKVADPTE